MKLSEILKETDIIERHGNEDIEIKNIKYNSKDIKKGDIFVAIEGVVFDGHNYIKDAIKNGACAIIHEKNGFHSDVVDIKVNDSRKAHAQISDRFLTPRQKI